MAKKKKEEKIEEDMYQINYQLDQLNARIMVLSTRLGDLSRYTEYIAGNVDFSISYTEHLADLFSVNSNSGLRVENNLLQSRRAPCYEEFKVIKGVQNNPIHPDQD
jgi:hypothetical protein